MRTVLFDVDGTLAETERDGHRVAFNRTFVASRVDANWDEALYGELVKVTGGRQRLEHYFVHHQAMPAEQASALAAELHIDKTAAFVEMIESSQLDPRPGVKELILQLQAQSIPTGIVTTGRRAWVEPLVAHLLGPDVFAKMDPVVTGDDVAELKPSPEAYLLAARKLQLQPEEAIAIEDSVNGVRSAKAAGMMCVAVPSLYNNTDDFSEADLVVAEFNGVSKAGETETLLTNQSFRQLVFGS